MSDKPKARGSLYIICYNIQVCQIKKVVLLHIFGTYLEEKKGIFLFILKLFGNP